MISHDDPVGEHLGAAGDRRLRSPPDSRMTGADSPVIADSSTLATPSTTSPSPGMTCPASTTTGRRASATSPARPRHARACGAVRRPADEPAGHGVASGSGAGSRPAPCPRPSATASARLAKSTVSQSQTVIDQAKTRRVARWRHDRGEHRADLDDEHHRVAPHERAGRACAAHPGSGRRASCSGRGAARDRRGASAGSAPGAGVVSGGRHQCRPSASGPSARAGT